MDDRGAAGAAPRSTPLTIVSGAVAGDDIARIAASASEALGRPVVVAIPALGGLVVRPEGALASEQMRAIVDYATTLIRGGRGRAPAPIAEIVAVRIGPEVVGIVGATPGPETDPDQLAWLEAAAAAAAVALMRETQQGGLAASRHALLQALAAGPAGDVGATVAQARRLGFDLSMGAVGLCAVAAEGQGATRADRADAMSLSTSHTVLLAELSNGRIYGLVPLESQAASDAEAVADELAALGMEVALSTPRRDPAALHEALREAELLIELTTPPAAPVSGQEETYRLLIGVLLRGSEELERLRSRTISPLADYDAQHDTDLLATLQAFLVHHGSTTETAEAMGLHRHTVGYRLSRVHEVSGLSPYESDGRERLSLGLKGHQILEAHARLGAPEPARP